LNVRAENGANSNGEVERWKSESEGCRQGEAKGKKKDRQGGVDLSSDDYREQAATSIAQGEHGHGVERGDNFGKRIRKSKCNRYFANRKLSGTLDDCGAGAVASPSADGHPHDSLADDRQLERQWPGGRGRRGRYELSVRLGAGFRRRRAWQYRDRAFHGRALNAGLFLTKSRLRLQQSFRWPLDSRYGSKGVRNAVENVQKQIAPALGSKDALNQREIDR
jgi:hypothetical protein